MEAILKRTAQRVHESDDEKLLIEQAQNGDREAFEQLVRRHDRDILRLAFHMLGNREEAREVFQETFLKAYRSLGRFRFESSFYTWVYRIRPMSVWIISGSVKLSRKRFPTSPTLKCTRTGRR